MRVHLVGSVERTRVLYIADQVVNSITTTLSIELPSFSLNFLNLTLVFELDLFSMPFFGCLTRGGFRVSFFLMTCGPPAFVAVLWLLQRLHVLRPAEVWRAWSMLLFLCFPRTCGILVDVFLCRTLADGTELRECSALYAPVAADVDVYACHWQTTVSSFEEFMCVLVCAQWRRT